MGRKSTLTQQQLDSARQRNLAGESLWQIAQDMGVKYNTLKDRLSAQIRSIKHAGNQILAAERSLAELPIDAQIDAVRFAEAHRDISHHMSQAGRYASMTTHRLTMLANAQANKLCDVDPMGADSQQFLAASAMLSKVANEASVIPRDLIKAGRTDTAPASDEKPESIQYEVIR